MFNKILLMSLLSLLFGCGKSSKSKEQFPDLAHFPQTDNTACRVEPVLMDSGFFAQTFILAPNKQNVFVLAFGVAGTLDSMPYQILRLDPAGRVQAKIEFPGCRWSLRPVFWWEDDGLLTVMLVTDLKSVDPASMQVVRQWRQLDFENFLTQKQFDRLTYDEQDDAYKEALQNAIQKSRSAHVRYDAITKVHLLMLEMNTGKNEAWQLRSAEEAEPFITQFGLRTAGLNPGADLEKGNILDGKDKLTYVARDVFDYKILYPNLKDVESRIFELSFAGGKKARFKLSNKKKRSLDLQKADNQYLSTADGAMWLLYEQQLYRGK